jgi:hypothetical protein
MHDHSNMVENLFRSQFREWPLARDNYGQLDSVRVRKVLFPGYEITVQFNPGRIVSSAAKVDAGSIKARPCFLCGENRPPEQRGVPFGSDYIILINPFPIFRRHLTIVNRAHTPQQIEGNFASMLSLAEALPDYVIFYNGPQCGASAPDHLHFQAGNRGFLPVEKDAGNPGLRNTVASSGGIELSLWSGYGRGMLTLEGSDSGALNNAFDRFYSRFAATQPERAEPMLNILAYSSGERRTIHIIPRRLHRPSCYFAEEPGRILLSPASVDMGGVFITPREEDYNKITAGDISSILEEVCLSDREIKSLTEGLL